jgi:hypothetical protein
MDLSDVLILECPLVTGDRVMLCMITSNMNMPFVEMVYSLLLILEQVLWLAVI